MQTSDDFVEYILESLSSLGKISASRMFGGVLLKVEGRQLGIIFKDVLYFKVTDKILQEKFKAEGSEQFVYTKKTDPKPIIIKNWWSAPDRIMDDNTLMVEFAKFVLEQE
jgi:DNA transformation protein